VYRRVAGRLIQYALCCTFSSGLALPAGAQGQLERQRQGYTAAIEAIERGDDTAFAALRSELDDYPLAIYLDYFNLVRDPRTVSPATALRFLDASRDTPLPNRFLGAYLRAAGEDRRWQGFLQVQPDEPNSVDLKCFYFRARLAVGDTASAWEGARRLWVQGTSQPPVCDPLFAAWQEAGELTDEVVWTRLLNAFEGRQSGLLNYVSGKSSAALRPWAETLLAVYRDPASLGRRPVDADTPRARDIASYGLAYLARYDPPKALAYWRDYQQRMAFSPEQVRKVEYAIALQALFAKSESQDEWLESALARLKDDKLVGIRLRWALSEQDWPDLARFLPLLSPTGQEQIEWRYWRAVLTEREGDTEGSRALLQPLAGERDYYGFLAADRLGRPYDFNHDRLALSDASPVTSLAAVRRIEELDYHDESVLAQGEWYTLLQDTTDPGTLQDLMLLASARGWDRMAIDAATRAEAWDALDQRFPTAHAEVFRRYAVDRGLPGSELMAIARRESAFYPRAESPAGARGLMQIMPATGAAVAASLKVPHSSARLFEVEHNVRLGSAYYRQLLDRFDGNRVFALAAYNAGPHRVDRWRHKAGEGLPVDLWIETIPYQETRNYVQAVLAYNVVFQYLLGDDSQQLLSPAERGREY